MGQNDKGQLANGTQDRNVLAKVEGLPRVRQMAVGDEFCVVLTRDGEVHTDIPIQRNTQGSTQMADWYIEVWNYIMAGRAFVVAKEVFIMETVVFWHCDNG